MASIHLSNHQPSVYYSNEYKWKMSFYVEAALRVVLILFLSFVASAQTAKISYGFSPSKRITFDKLEWTVKVSNISDKPRDTQSYWLLETSFASSAADAIQFGLNPNDSVFKDKSTFLTFKGVGITPVSGNCKPLDNKDKSVACSVKYAWERGVPYKFVVELNSKATKTGTNRWIGTIVNGQTGETVQIGELDVPATYGMIKPTSSGLTKWLYTTGTPPCNDEAASFELTSLAPVGYSKGTQYETQFLGHSDKSPCAVFKVVDEHTVMVTEK